MDFCVQPRREDQDARGVEVLHLSLNAPVIAIDELPVGPARAGIALCRDSAGDVDLRIAVRSLRTGQLVVYGPTVGSPDAGGAALEAALSFAETMGFLFDEDEVAARGEGAETAVSALWRDLVEEVPERLRDLASGAESAAAAPAVESEALLDVPVVSDASRSQAVCIETLQEVAAPRVPVSPASVLSKFRMILGGAVAPARPPEVVALDEDPALVSVASQHSRIRLLSRF